MIFGTCYYPEHWPRGRWAEDARLMAGMGLRWVRVAEFAWSRIEPARGRFHWEWLDAAVDTLGAAGLQVVMCTPTATPPKWLVEERPDILATGIDGRVRGFGSRRHYSFSSRAYREESRRITRAVAERYGANPYVVAWQTDNEYGCHETVEDYGPEAEAAFQEWLAAKYGTVEALNAAWGNVFWSMEYPAFASVGVPAGAVTELNPAHRLDFQRFSSDQVAAFDAEQVAILRELSPGRTLIHNTMGVSLDFDHFQLGAGTDMFAWDSYPLGFLEQSRAGEAHKNRFARQGDPDFQSFHHDLYRNCTPQWGVMEQQNGPVNWAPSNPAPAPGMVRLWSLEAWAHGAALLSYFRWRQCPFAQEQNHSGLLQVDGALSHGGREVENLRAELDGLGAAGGPVREVALVFDYTAEWVTRIQPQGEHFRYWELVQMFYRAIRSLGLNVDVVGPDAALSEFKMVVAPSLPVVDAAAFANLSAPVLFGPRSGSKTADFAVPGTLPPGALQALLPIRIPRWQSLREGMAVDVVAGDAKPGGHTYPCPTWVEDIELTGQADIHARTTDGAPVWVASGHAHYLGTWPTPALLKAMLQRLAAKAGLATLDLPEALRLRKLADGREAWFNYGATAATAPGVEGNLELAPFGAIVR